MAFRRPAMHDRTASQLSQESTSSNGSGHRMIVEHLLTYPGSYELPLRTMYTLNSTPRVHLARNQSHTSSTSPPPSPSRSDYATQQLTTSLMAEVSQMSNHQQSLPPSFVTAFVRKCFASELNFVDFPQALTALDYLKDLECRRRKEMKAALERLNIRLDALDAAEYDLTERYPGALEWYHSLEEKEHEIEALYSQLYISLRRWVLLNELMLEPFSKHNCIAMLNTLYSPAPSAQPTPQLTFDILRKQREGFFRYIQGVEKQGPIILKNLIEQGKRTGEETGWPAVRETLDKYLLAANSTIDECSEILHINDPACLSRRKADSGISLMDASRKSSNASMHSVNSAERVQQSLQPVKQPTRPQYKSTSTLEKIARELKHMTRSRTDVSEIIEHAAPEPVSPSQAAPTKNVRKMKSMNSISARRSLSRKSSFTSTSSNQGPIFDKEEMTKQRLMYDARTAQSVGLAF